jgi:hypothetical protein
LSGLGSGRDLWGLDDPTRLDAFGTHPHPDNLSVAEDSYLLKVRQPYPFRSVIGMADVIAPLRTFVTYIALPRHHYLPSQKVFFITFFFVGVKEFIMHTNDQKYYEEKFDNSRIFDVICSIL